MKKIIVTVLCLGFIGVSALTTLAKGAEVQSDRRSEEAHFLIHFGHGVSTNSVTEEQINDFFKTVVTPAFPSGLTYWEAKGQRADLINNKIDREITTVMLIGAPDNSETRDKVSFVAKQYIQRFEAAGVAVYVVELGRTPATIFFAVGPEVSVKNAEAGNPYSCRYR